MKNFLFTLMAITASGILAAQAVTIDQTESATTTSGSPSVSNFTVPFTVSANNDRLLMVCVSNSVNASAPTVSFNSIPMLQLATEVEGGLRLTMYYLVLGSSGSETAANIIASGTNMKNIGAVSFYNVLQSTPLGVPVSIAINPPVNVTFPSSFSLDVASQSNDMVCDCAALGVVSGATGISANAGQTGIANNISAGTQVIFGMSAKAGADPNVNIGWTIGGTLGITGQAVHHGVNIFSVNSPVPVELTYFKGETLADNSVQLLWQTASELNNEGFYIQRSKDGVHWKDLGFEPGYGTTVDVKDYVWIDTDPMSGANYYRLRQVDTDGTFEFSPVVLVQIVGSSNQKMVVYPNPSSGDLFYHLDDLNAVNRIQLFDGMGKMLQETTQIDGTFSIDHLPAGLYWFSAETNTGRLYERIVKH